MNSSRRARSLSLRGRGCLLRRLMSISIGMLTGWTDAWERVGAGRVVRDVTCRD